MLGQDIQSLPGTITYSLIHLSAEAPAEPHVLTRIRKSQSFASIISVRLGRRQSSVWLPLRTASARPRLRTGSRCRERSGWLPMRTASARPRVVRSGRVYGRTSVLEPHVLELYVIDPYGLEPYGLEPYGLEPSINILLPFPRCYRFFSLRDCL